MNELIEIYDKIKPEILHAMKRFQEIGKSEDEKLLFQELCFCLLTPQSKARMAEKIMDFLVGNNLLYTADMENSEFRDAFRFVRFKNNKASYVITLRKMVFTQGYSLVGLSKMNPLEAREMLVKDIKGIGFKEASHFLRNIGKGGALAILDRHILRNMKKFGLIANDELSLTKKNYYAYEKKLLEFSDIIGIPPDHLDFVLWYKEAGEVFK